MVFLDYRDARPIYTQICDGIRQQIITGVLREGDKLPSVRELATQLTINPNTIQRAYRELEMEGWMVSKTGKGCFVSGVPGGMEQKKQEMLQQLDALAEQCQALGMTRQQLAEHLMQGGNGNA